MMVALGNSSRTTSSPSPLVRRNCDGLLNSVGGVSLEAFIADMWMNLKKKVVFKFLFNKFLEVSY